MSTQKVSAGRGWQWVMQAVDLVKRYPAPFLLMGLIIGIIGVIPVLGGLVLLFLGPALIAGTCYAAQQAERGGKPEVGHLFRGFQESDRIGSLVALCLPTVIGAILIGIILAIFIVGAASAGGMAMLEQAEANPMVLVAALGSSLLLLVPLVLIVALGIYAATFFAIPRTLLERPAAIANMKDSVRASLRNLGAFLIAVFVLLVLVALVSIIFSMLHLDRIGSIVASTALYAVLGPTLYFAWSEVCGAPAASAQPPDAAPFEGS